MHLTNVKAHFLLLFLVLGFVRASCANSTTLHTLVCIFPRNIGASRYRMNCGAGLFVVVSQASVLWPRVPNLFHTGPPRRFVWLGWPSEGQWFLPRDAVGLRLKDRSKQRWGYEQDTTTNRSELLNSLVVDRFRINVWKGCVIQRDVESSVPFVWCCSISMNCLLYCDLRNTTTWLLQTNATKANFPSRWIQGVFLARYAYFGKLLILQWELIPHNETFNVFVHASKTVLPSARTYV